jgi:hypothetical protein
MLIALFFISPSAPMLHAYKSPLAVCTAFALAFSMLMVAPPSAFAQKKCPDEPALYTAAAANTSAKLALYKTAMNDLEATMRTKNSKQAEMEGYLWLAKDELINNGMTPQFDSYMADFRDARLARDTAKALIPSLYTDALAADANFGSAVWAEQFVRFNWASCLIAP